MQWIKLDKFNVKSSNILSLSTKCGIFTTSIKNVKGSIMKSWSLRLKLILGAVLGLTLTLAAVILTGWLAMQKNGQEAVKQASTSFESLVVSNLHDAASSVATEVSVFINRRRV